MNYLELLASGTVGSVATGILAFLTRRSEMGKINAEIQTLKAQAEMTTAQADDLVSARLIRELDRISETNDRLSHSLEIQHVEIGRLRSRILKFAAREHRHILEKDALRNELAKFIKSDSPILRAIMQRFPIVDTLSDADDDDPQVPENQ